MQKKKDYTHEQIVEIAKREFLKNGYAKTSMRDIAKGAGIGVSNIYNYFKSKDELFARFAGQLLRMRWMTLAIFTLVLVLSVIGMKRMVKETSFDDYFIEDDPMLVMTDEFKSHFGYDYFHADAGMFSVYKKNSELFFKLKYSF